MDDFPLRGVIQHATEANERNRHHGRAEGGVCPERGSPEVLVGSNEHRLSELGPYSPLCDQLGADFLVMAHGKFVGIQRKACEDLISSLRDGRLYDFLTKRTEMVLHSVLLIEGDWNWNLGGQSRRCPGWTEDQLNGLKLSLQIKHDVIVVETRSVEHTAARLPVLESWFQNADKASSLLAVPKQNNGVWGPKGTALRIWQCVPGISLGLASSLYDAVGLPLALTVDDKELGAVAKVGPKRVKAIRETFNGVPAS